jgi:hypothetical protein
MPEEKRESFYCPITYMWCDSVRADTLVEDNRYGDGVARLTPKCMMSLSGCKNQVHAKFMKKLGECSNAN